MEDFRSELQKEMDKFNADDLETYTSLDSAQLAMIFRSPKGGESTKQSKQSDPLSLHSEDSCMILFNENVPKIINPPTDPSSNVKRSPNHQDLNKEMVTNTNKGNYTKSHTHTQPGTHTRTALLSSIPLMPVSGANPHIQTQTHTQPHTHTSPLSSALYSGPEIGANICLHTEVSNFHTNTTTTAPAHFIQATVADTEQHQTPTQSQPQPKPHTRTQTQHQTQTKTQHQALTKTQLQNCSPVKNSAPNTITGNSWETSQRNNNNKRHLSSSPNAITSISKRIFHDESNATSYDQGCKIDLSPNPPVTEPNPRDTPIVQSVELLRNFFSQLKETQLLPHKKASYSNVLQQGLHSASSSPKSTPISSAPPGNVATTKPSNESSSIDMGPTHQIVKAIIHTPPDLCPQQSGKTNASLGCNISSPPSPNKKTPAFKSLFAQKLYRERQEYRAEAHRCKSKNINNRDREGFNKDTINRNKNSRNSYKNNNKTPPAPAPPRKPLVPLMSLPLYAPKNSHALTQCHRCQKYGHTKGSCRRNFVCMKCAGQHPTTACKKPRHIPPRCCNCGGRHVSLYKGCRVFQDLKRKVAQETQYSVAHPERHRAFRTENRMNVEPIQRQHHLSNNYWDILRNDERFIRDPRHYGPQIDRHYPHKSPNPRPRLAQPSKHRNNYNSLRPQKHLKPNPAEAHLARFQERLKLEKKQEKEPLEANSQQHWHKLQENIIKLHEKAHLKVLAELSKIENQIKKLSILFNKITNVFDNTEMSTNNDTLANLSGSIHTIEMASLIENISAANDLYYV